MSGKNGITSYPPPTTMPPRATTPTKVSGAITAVLGSDEGLVKAEALKLSESLAPPDAGEFGVEIIDGVAEHAAAAVTRIHETIAALQTLPFFGGGKLVWLKNANFLADSPTGRAGSVIEALESLTATLAAGLGPDVRLLLSATEVDKRRSFYKGLGKVADVRVFDRLDSSKSGWEEEAGALAIARATARGLELEPEAAELFALLTGGDTRQVENELEKLDLYLGPDRREVEPEDVRTMVPLSRAGVIFELGNALSRREPERALSLVGQLLRQGESAIGILLVAIIPTVRNLLLTKDLAVRHRLSRPSAPFTFAKTLERLPAEATAHLPRKKDGTLNAYALGFAAMEAHRFTLEELRAGLEACLEANVQLVSSGLDERLVLERVLIALLAAPAKD